MPRAALRIALCAFLAAYAAAGPMVSTTHAISVCLARICAAGMPTFCVPRGFDAEDTPRDATDPWQLPVRSCLWGEAGPGH